MGLSHWKPLLYAEFRTQKMIACCRYWLAQHVMIQNLDLLISKLVLVLNFFLNVFDFLFSRSKLFLDVLGKIAPWILLLHKSKICTLSYLLLCQKIKVLKTRYIKTQHLFSPCQRLGYLAGTLIKFILWDF